MIALLAFGFPVINFVLLLMLALEIKSPAPSNGLIIFTMVTLFVSFWLTLYGFAYSAVQ